MPEFIANHSPASQQFTAAIHEFEKTNNIKIAEFLSSRLPEHEALIEEFFSIPVIYNYLSRTAESVRFLNNKPANSCLTPSEIEIYQLRPDLFPFRGRTDDQFYLTGADKYGGTVDKFYLSLQNQYNQEHVSITSAQDIYEIKEYLKDELVNMSKPLHRFVITPNWKDTHATCLVHIINPETRRIMASIFINSWQSQEYTNFISYRFNLDTNRDSNTAGHAKIPFIDASHHIQVSPEDSNCTIYGYKFIEAVAKMLNEPLHAQRIFALAENVEKGNLQASNDLREIFNEELKNYLPCYYTNKHHNAPADIKEFHLQQRWNIGSEVFACCYAPKPTAEKISSEPKRVNVFKPIFSNQVNNSSLEYVGKDHVIKYVFDHVLPVIENEKIRLIKKYPPVDNKFFAGKKDIKRIGVLNNLSNQICEELANFEDHPEANPEALKKNIEDIINRELNAKAMDKYSGWGKKLALTLCNILLSLPIISLPLKKLITGSWFFSLEGKTIESSKTALQELQDLPTARC